MVLSTALHQSVPLTAAKPAFTAKAESWGSVVSPFSESTATQALARVTPHVPNTKKWGATAGSVMAAKCALTHTRAALINITLKLNLCAFVHYSVEI